MNEQSKSEEVQLSSLNIGDMKEQSSIMQRNKIGSYQLTKKSNQEIDAKSRKVIAPSDDSEANIDEVEEELSF